MFQRTAGKLRGKGLGKIPLVQPIYKKLNTLLSIGGRYKIINITSFGTKLKVDLRDTGDLTPTLLSKGIYDPTMSRMVDMLSVDGTCIDIGANIGYFTTIMAKKARKVYAYEPLDSNFHLLEENLRLNDTTNSIPILKAISNKDGTEKLVITEGHIGSNYLTQDEYKNTILVDVSKLDTVHKGEIIDLIKVDVQGYEGKILEGMEDLVKVNKDIDMIWAYLPKALLRAGTVPLEFLNRLGKLGTLIDLDEKENNIVELTPEKFLDKYGMTRHTNILVVKRSIN